MQTAVCQGTVTVPLPAPQALSLFTAEGERTWVPDWTPEFPAAVTDDTEPGVVWLSRGEQGVTYWVVGERAVDGMTYARVTPGLTAGLVQVRAEPGDGATTMRVTYRLTALTAEGEEFLTGFAGQFDQMMALWQRLIDNMLHAE